MSSPIEDYGIIGNTYTAALVSRGGSIDWLCLPRFDSESVFGALLGEPKHGRWLIEPAAQVVRRSRRYRGDTGILETQFETAEGCVTLIDFIALTDREEQIDLIRLVRGDKGHPLTRGYSCAKGVCNDELHNSPDRLLHPMKRMPDGSFAAIPLAHFHPHIALGAITLVTVIWIVPTARAEPCADNGTR